MSSGFLDRAELISGSRILPLVSSLRKMDVEDSFLAFLVLGFPVSVSPMLGMVFDPRISLMGIQLDSV